MTLASSCTGTWLEILEGVSFRGGVTSAEKHLNTWHHRNGCSALYCLPQHELTLQYQCFKQHCGYRWTAGARAVVVAKFSHRTPTQPRTRPTIHRAPASRRALLQPSAGRIINIDALRNICSIQPALRIPNPSQLIISATESTSTDFRVVVPLPCFFSTAPPIAHCSMIPAA